GRPGSEPRLRRRDGLFVRAWYAPYTLASSAEEARTLGNDVPDCPTLPAAGWVERLKHQSLDGRFRTPPPRRIPVRLRWQHDLLRKPVSTFRDHALMPAARRQDDWRRIERRIFGGRPVARVAGPFAMEARARPRRPPDDDFLAPVVRTPSHARVIAGHIGFDRQHDRPIDFGRHPSGCVQ